MHPFFFVYLALALLALRLSYIIFRALTSPLRHVPGPLLARFTRLYYFYMVWSTKAHLKNIELHRKYAKPGQYYAQIVRLAPNMYSIASPDKAAYGIGSKMAKSSWYEGWKHPSPDRWTLFADRDSKRHAETRRKFQGMYAMSSMKGYEGYVNECSDIFEQRLREVADQDQAVDMSNALQCYAFDVIGDITYSKRFGFLDSFHDIQGAMKKLEAVMMYGTLVGIYSWAHPYLYSLLERIPGTGAAGRTFIMKYVTERMNERDEQRKAWKKEGKGVEAREDMPQDFLDKLMDLEEDGQAKGVNRYNVFMLGLSNIGAGSDTTSVSLASILYNLITSPESIKKLRKEIEDATAEGNVKDNLVSWAASQEMPYLQACIKEGLRLHPATGLPLWRVVHEGGSDVCGQFFPAGQEVGLNTWVAHYDKDIWGEDVETFRPERWIEAEKEGAERLKKMDEYYLPVGFARFMENSFANDEQFGLGSRTCIGRHVSYLEMAKLIPRMVQTFDFELENQNQQLDHWNFWFVKQRGFSVKVRLRSS